jgi:hypothetical protein
MNRLGFPGGASVCGRACRCPCYLIAMFACAKRRLLLIKHCRKSMTERRTSRRFSTILECLIAGLLKTRLRLKLSAVRSPILKMRYPRYDSHHRGVLPRHFGQSFVLWGGARGNRYGLPTEPLHIFSDAVWFKPGACAPLLPYGQ